MKTETPIVAAIIDAVNASTLAFVWRNHAGSARVRRGYMHFAPEGAPDVVGFARDGIFVGLEVKVPGERTAKERAAKQLEWRERIRAAKGITGEVRHPAEALALLRIHFFGHAGALR